jgi:hypothetical protein
MQDHTLQTTVLIIVNINSQFNYLSNWDSRLCVVVERVE